MTDTKVPDSGLARAVALNEEIKRVIGVAFKANLMALNAILLAKRAGASATGFRVLSTELREFIAQLQETMIRLRGQTQDMVRAVTEEVRQRRVGRSLSLAAEALVADRSPHGDALDAVLLSRARVEALRLQRFDTIDRALRGTLGDAADLSQFGAVLARTAKIEAVYGGDFSKSLTEVALDFDAIIQDIIGAIDALRRTQNGGMKA
jgi:hypothetical protein